MYECDNGYRVRVGVGLTGVNKGGGGGGGTGDYMAWLITSLPHCTCRYASWNAVCSTESEAICT